jgi:hypothetical protein
LSAISATFSSGWTARQVSTAFFAPGISSGWSDANNISTILQADRGIL